MKDIVHLLTQKKNKIMNKLLLVTVLFFLSCNLVYGQDYKIIGSVNDLKLIQLDDKIGVMNYNDEIIIQPSNYSKIEFDGASSLYKCYINDEFKLFTENGTTIQSDYLFTELSSSMDDNDEWEVRSKLELADCVKTKLLYHQFMIKSQVRLKA